MSGLVRTQRSTLLVSSISILVTLFVLPLGGHHLGPTTSYVPAVLATVACFDIMSVWLLAGEYLDTGDRRMLGMTLAYLWSLLLMGGYALAFPGVISSHPPLAVTSSVAPYLYIGWHAGFPALLGAAWAPWSYLGGIEHRPRAARLAAAMAGMCAAALLAVTGCVLFATRLPVLIQGLDTSGMAKVTAPVALPLVVASLLVCARAVRGRTGPERWSSVAILVCLCDLCLTYASRYRYSLGWYTGRTLTVAASAIVLIAMLASFRRLKATAEFNAAYDGLTGLANRRSAYDAATAMIARARRTGTPLSVVMFDLDRFKQINDGYGHAAGDEVLRCVASTMRATVRDSDLSARLGGEEFAMVLPDAGLQDARVVAERLRAQLRARTIPAIGSSVTASFGIAELQPADATAENLLHRADQAMYRAKALGRDQVADQPADRWAGELVTGLQPAR
ncbi:MAG TPA: sensor domain-containing diguanylate cyclase [Jatrophihabitans sp.]|uniref:GGDEF domain-containing protein n=1 Tax=Jatrophihabitans sp. TaxID=1932789 RepID=UPI002F000C05